MKKRKNAKMQNLVAGIFLVLLAIFFLGNLLKPTKGYSEQENRSLAGRPQLTWTSVVSGMFAEQYEKYQSDQLIGRNLWRDLAVNLRILTGSNKENGIFYGRQNQLLEEIRKPDEESFQANLEAIQDFAGRHKELPMSILIVPDAAGAFPERLPAFAETENQMMILKRIQRELEETVTWIDVSEVFAEHAEEKLYYQTDSHWTSLGAYYGFQASGEALGIEQENMTNFVPYPVTAQFNGTLSARSGYAKDIQEEITIYIPGGKDIEVVVNYVDKQEKRTSIYQSDALEGRDKYQVFLGGNDSLVDIRTTSDSDRRLLIFKDSSANCFVQFLIPYFREIVLVDPRYYAGDIEELLDMYHVTDGLFLYRGNIFSRDNQLSGVLTSE
ncbi:MAG: hypothetical protein HFH53_02105 [Hespellia sp.]|jgi:hypothetical protein|nr:hypothetical protein [Hespellia sp.]